MGLTVTTKVKVILLLTALLSVDTELLAQNWRTINPNSETYFSHNSVSVYFDMYATRFDSLEVVGQDSLWYNYKVVDYNNKWGSCVSIEDTSWLGAFALVKPDGWNYFFNASMDTIRFNTRAKLNENWPLIDLPNGGYLQATVTAIDTSIILGVVDSTKTLTIQAKDSMNLDITHVFNGKTFILTKSHGFDKLYDLYWFPNWALEKELIGMSNPERGIVNLIANDIFNFEVGDDFQYTGGQDILGVMFSKTYEQKIVLSKSVSTNLDTIRYTFYKKSFYKTIYYNPNSVSSGFSEDTVSESVVLSTQSLFAKLPYEPWIDMNNYGVGYFDMPLQPVFQAYNLRRRKGMYSFYFYDSVQNCFTVPVGMCIFGTQTYAEGLGKVYSGDNTSPSCNGEGLVFFQKGTETWGNPLNWETILGTSELGLEESGVFMYPNPASNNLNVVIQHQFNNDKMELMINDIHGRHVLRFDLNNDSTNVLDISMLSPGIYVLHLLGNVTTKSSVKLIVQ